jgi:hypothetical protein
VNVATANKDAEGTAGHDVKHTKYRARHHNGQAKWGISKFACTKLGAALLGKECQWLP